MGTDVSKLPVFVMADIIAFLIDNNKAANELIALRRMASMSRRELMDCYLSWNGVIGWTEQIMTAIDGVDRACRDMRN